MMTGDTEDNTGWSSA